MCGQNERDKMNLHTFHDSNKNWEMELICHTTMKVLCMVKHSNQRWRGGGKVYKARPPSEKLKKNLLIKCNAAKQKGGYTWYFLCPKIFGKNIPKPPLDVKPVCIYDSNVF